MEVADLNLEYEGLNEFERTLLRLTMFRLDDLFGFFTFSRLNAQIKKIQEIPDLPSPKFAFIHIVAPHPPYVFSPTGEFKLKKKFPANSWEPKSDYIDQLEYISRVTNSYVNKILQKRNKNRPQPIIILQSDHGPWISSFLEEDVYSCRTGILNAYLVPVELQKKIYPTISPVNTFRLISNQLFNCHLKLLTDFKPDLNTLRENQIYSSKIIK